MLEYKKNKFIKEILYMSLAMIINELIVENVENSIKFYEENFKFKAEITEGKPITWTQLRKDEVIIMLEDYNTVKNSISKYPNKVNSSNLIKFEYDELKEVVVVILLSMNLEHLTKLAASFL